ncbi:MULTISPECIES: porin [unclassified Burkholderia]|uniref:porin n=1 Tax=unclassified Burkholderia TaxID=2613784 RepID=UPI000F562645|nr:MULTISPECIES: porin [unclassified Burkholderia]RQR68353.1 porin [Burkholderia sp. Bp9012]RQR70287.1 porin [Burkholderia sp. Bp9011]RQR83034.1 porin [Burkholderia sp. Bp9010]RQZ38746.1 porin [Burkholderia sp. Bp9099]
MKLRIAAAVAMAILSAPVFAQSSVTLYGLIDEGIDYTNNVGGKHVYELQSGFVQGSRWGLRGTEDLGGGLSAIFKIESGFNVNNGKLGQGGLGFGRQAYVGLANDRYGTLTFGRQYDSVVDYLAQTTANGNWAGYMFSHPYDNDNTDNTFRVNNTVKYASPEIAGFQFGGTYSFSNGTEFANNRQYSVGAQYTNGGLLVAAAYLQADNPSATSSGAINNGGDENFLAKRLRVFGGGINYTFGPATAGFAYTNSYLNQPQSTTYISGSILPVVGTLNSLRFQNFEVNFKYQFTPALYAGAAYTFTTENFNASSGNAEPKVHQVGLMADYNLSKRTDIYVQGAYQHVAGDKTGTSLDLAYVPGAADASSTSNQFVIRAAIRHKF